MSGATDRQGAPAASMLSVIYIALISGVVIFAAVVRLVIGPLGEYDGPAMRFVWLAAAAGCTLAVGYFRTRLAGPQADESQAATAAIVVWALAEGQALLAVVAYMLSGDVLVLWLGLALFAYLFARYRPAVFRPTRPR